MGTHLELDWQAQWTDCFIDTSSYKDFWVCSSGTKRKFEECRQSLTQKWNFGINFVLPQQGHVGQMCRHLAVGPTRRQHVGNIPSQASDCLAKHESNSHLRWNIEDDSGDRECLLDQTCRIMFPEVCRSRAYSGVLPHGMGGPISTTNEQKSYVDGWESIACS